MVTVKGLQVFNQSKYEKIKKELIYYFSNENNEIFGLITRSYLDEKRGVLNTSFEKNTFEYFRDVLIEKNSFHKNNLNWFKSRNEVLFYRNMAQLIHHYGSFENAYKKGKKEFKMKKNGTINPVFSLIFDNDKKIIIIQENHDFFINPYYGYELDKSAQRTKRDVFFEYNFFHDNNLFNISRKNKTLLIENIIEKKLGIPCKKIFN